MSTNARKHFKHSNLRQVQGGFSLIEILVTVIIIAVGLLGTAALNLVSLRNNSTSLIRSEATALASDITDRMRANRPTAIAQGYDAVTPANAQALTDVTEWRALLAQALPNGTGTIVVVPATRVATITISWSEREAGAAGAAGTQTFTTTTEI